MKRYDYLVVGAGLFGAVFAHEAVKRGKTCLVIDKRDHIGGNIYTKEIEGIQAHCYGAHIFHTSSRRVWDYVNQFAQFNHFVNSPIAVYKDELYNLPFNMNTFHQLWGVITPAQAQAKIQEQIAQMHIVEPNNLEEQALALVQSCGYKSLFWSFAYKDWITDSQPDPATALDTMLKKAHPGAIYLLHAVSSTNARVLGDFIDGMREKGFVFSDFA